MWGQFGQGRDWLNYAVEAENYATEATTRNTTYNSRSLGLEVVSSSFVVELYVGN